MATWLYAASQAKASLSDTLSLACRSGFIWRPFYNQKGSPIACVKHIQVSDTLLLGYRAGGQVKLLGRFRVGRPDEAIDASPVFGVIPETWRAGFQSHGYTVDPILNKLVGIFVEECEPLTGSLAYKNQNSLSMLDNSYPFPMATRSSVEGTRGTVDLRVENHIGELTTHRSGGSIASAERSTQSFPIRDGLHIGIDVGGRWEKGFDLCITEWSGGALQRAEWMRLPHTFPLPSTSSLRNLVRDGDLAGVARATQMSASKTAANLWRVLEKCGAAGIHIDSPSAFSRNRLGHGRRCEKRSLTGVSFQSTPSIACKREHGGDWGWLLYGMIAFAACLHRGSLSPEDWLNDLSVGSHSRFDSAGTIVHECFPTATISVLRASNRLPDVELALGKAVLQPEVQAVIAYLKHGVAAVKRPTQSIYDRADALVAALGALPYVSHAFEKSPYCGMHGKNWDGTADDERIEGTFLCVQ